MTACPYCTNPRCWRIDPPQSFRKINTRFPADPIVPFEFERELSSRLIHQFGASAGRSAPPHLRAIASEVVALQRAMTHPKTRAELAAVRKRNARVRESTDKQLQRLRGHARKLIHALSPDSLLSSCVLDADLDRVDLVQMLRDIEMATLSTRGAPPLERKFELNVAVVVEHFGIPLTTTGKYARILDYIYEAIRHEVPKDGRYGITRVIDQIRAGEWSWCAYEFHVRQTAYLRYAFTAAGVTTWRLPP